VENFINSKKNFDGGQSIRELKEIKSQRQEHTDNIKAFEDIELTLEHESIIRKVLFGKNIIPDDTTEESM
jgi:hypothetical protein